MTTQPTGDGASRNSALLRTFQGAFIAVVLGTDHTQGADKHSYARDRGSRKLTTISASPISTITIPIVNSGTTRSNAMPL